MKRKSRKTVPVWVITVRAWAYTLVVEENPRNYYVLLSHQTGCSASVQV